MWVILFPNLEWIILETWHHLQETITYHPDAEYHPLFADES